jgi:glutamyl-tRNA reductase
LIAKHSFIPPKTPLQCTLSPTIFIRDLLKLEQVRYNRQMELALLGIDHSKIEIKNMEPIFLTKEEKTFFRKAFKTTYPQHELVLLTTCNRIEFYYTAANKDEIANWIMSQLSKQKNVDETLIRSLFILHNQTTCIQHLFEVASGVQSMVFGENEILGQVKDAYDTANSESTTGTYLNKVFQSAVATGKRARSETLISRGSYSVSSIAIDALRQAKLDYFADNILIIGMGIMGIRCIKKCDALGHPSLTIANRTQEKTKAITNEHNVQAISYEEALNTLNNYDIIIAATSSRDPIITASMLNETPQIFVDLGLPRNIDPAISAMNNKLIINVDDLKLVATKNIKRKEEEISKVMQIIDREKERLFHWMDYKKQHA